MPNKSSHIKVAADAIVFGYSKNGGVSSFFVHPAKARIILFSPC